MAATEVIAFVIEAIRKTVSTVIGVLSPRRRMPKAPCGLALSVTTIATTPGTSFASTASQSTLWMHARGSPTLSCTAASQRASIKHAMPTKATTTASVPVDGCIAAT